jgi:hypothetical protein
LPFFFQSQSKKKNQEKPKRKKIIDEKIFFKKNKRKKQKKQRMLPPAPRPPSTKRLRLEEDGDKKSTVFDAAMQDHQKTLAELEKCKQGNMEFKQLFEKNRALRKAHEKRLSEMEPELRLYQTTTVPNLKKCSQQFILSENQRKEYKKLYLGLQEENKNLKRRIAELEVKSASFHSSKPRPSSPDYAAVRASLGMSPPRFDDNIPEHKRSARRPPSFLSIQTGGRSPTSPTSPLSPSYNPNSPTFKSNLSNIITDPSKWTTIRNDDGTTTTFSPSSPPRDDYDDDYYYDREGRYSF